MSKLRRSFLYLLLVPLGILASLAYVEDILVPPVISVSTMTVVVLVSILGFIKISNLSFLPRVMMLLYAMTFLHLWGYVFNPKFVFSPAWIASYVYQQDPQVYTKLCLVGLVGAIGLSIGFLAASGSVRSRDYRYKQVDKLALSIIPFSVLATIAYFLSLSSHPLGGTIFTSSAMDLASNSVYLGSMIRFNAGYTASYVLLSVLAVDVIRDTSSLRRHAKIWVLLIVISIVIIFHNILKGDRVVAGLILALIGLYINSQKLRGNRSQTNSSETASKGRFFRAVLVLGIVYVVFLTLGTWRTVASHGVGFFEKFNSIVDEGYLFDGPWTAVLYPPLSIVGDQVSGLKTLRWGATHIDLFLSFPPSIIASLLGYVRPFDLGGLAKEFRFSQGGCHAVVLPLMDFSAFGVLIILGFWGYFFGRAERVAQSGSKWHLYFWASLLVSSFGWAWYGYLEASRGIMSAYIFWWVYQIVLFVDATITGRLHTFSSGLSKPA